MSPTVARIAGYVGVFVAGFFVGLITTLQHRSFAPAGLIVGLGTVVAFAVGLRLVFRSRAVTFSGLLGVLAAQLLLASGIRNSFVVTADPLGYALTLGVVIIAVVAIGWPDVQRRAGYDGDEEKHIKE